MTPDVRLPSHVMNGFLGARRVANGSDTRTAVRLVGVTAAYDGVGALHDADLDIAPGEILALLGPSGCGKTTLLRSIAGLHRPSSGEVEIGGTLMSGGRTWVRPEKRSVGMVFQDGALFPHLTVAENVAFGLGRQAGGADARVAELLELVDLADYADRAPGTLSGGQRQRVALARALAPSPSVLLLDEPFSALDAALRGQIRGEIGRILRDVGVTTVFVTHDQDEAFVLGDRVAVMSKGRIHQVDTPDALYRRPADAWVAGFVGEANLVDADATGGFADTPFGAVPLDGSHDGPVTVLVRPEQLKLHPGAEGEIVDVEYYGHDARYGVRIATGLEVAARDTDADLRERGSTVGVSYSGPPARFWVR